MTGWLRRHYGAGPLQLAGVVACIAVAGYAVTQVLRQSGWPAIFLWFAACIVLHDFIGWPVYTLADRLLTRPQRRAGPPGSPVPTGAGSLPPNGAPSGRSERPAVPWVNHVRFPVVISGLLLFMFFPLVLRLSNQTYEDRVGYSENGYLANWLGVTAFLCAVSAAVYLARLMLARRRAQKHR